MEARSEFATARPRVRMCVCVVWCAWCGDVGASFALEPDEKNTIANGDTRRAHQCAKSEVFVIRPLHTPHPHPHPSHKTPTVTLALQFLPSLEEASAGGAKPY